MIYKPLQWADLRIEYEKDRVDDSTYQRIRSGILLEQNEEELKMYYYDLMLTVEFHGLSDDLV